MDSTPAARIPSSIDPQTVVYALAIGEKVTVFSFERGALYQTVSTPSGRYSIPALNTLAHWSNMAATCAFTAPANPAVFFVGPIGERLGQFWAALPDPAAEQRVSVAEFLALAQQ